MYFFNSLALAAAVLSPFVHATSCVDDGGNWYCDEVTAIKYSNFGVAGTYDSVTDMDETTGDCTFGSKNFSGIIAPFNEELSIHIRGPVILKQFAYYTTTASSKKTRSSSRRDRRRDTDDFSDEIELEERGSTYSWTRESYYCADSGTADEVTFLNNLGGGTYPGIWSETFGNSLGYASATGCDPAMEPTVLADTTLPSTTEISLWAGSKCSSSDPCPYYRPGSVAYHGFAGHRKIFLFEFSMPHASGDDMPAIWFLNARIPRTQQYGTCSCWGNTDGCGELDAFETLSSGSEKMVSSVHSVQAATDPNYFARPSNGTIKAAVSFRDSKVVLKILPDDAVIGEGLTAGRVAHLFNIPAASTGLSADYVLGN